MILIIGIQIIEADEAMQDFEDRGNKKQEIDISEMISKLNASKKSI